MPPERNCDSKTKMTFVPQYQHFLVKIVHFCPQWPQWFSDMLVPTLLVPLEKNRMFGPIMAILAPKRPYWPQNMYILASIGLAGSFGAVLGGCFLVAGCGLLYR